MSQNEPLEKEEDPRLFAERLFGAPAHVILISDHAPPLSFLGWRLGTGRAEAEERDGAGRVVDVEIYFDEEGRYAVAERSDYPGADGQRVLDAVVTVLSSPAEVRSYCDDASFDPMRDAALCTALDHVAHTWPFLERRRRRPSMTPAFLKAVLDDKD